MKQFSLFKKIKNVCVTKMRYLKFCKQQNNQAKEYAKEYIRESIRKLAWKIQDDYEYEGLDVGFRKDKIPFNISSAYNKVLLFYYTMGLLKKGIRITSFDNDRHVIRLRINIGKRSVGRLGIPRSYD